MSFVFPVYLNKRSKQPTSVQLVKTIINPAPAVVVKPAPVAVIKPAPVAVIKPPPVVVETSSYHDTISMKTTPYGIKNYTSTSDLNIIKKRNILL